MTTKYSHLKNDELVRRFVHNTTTELEAELIRRLQILMDAYDEVSDNLEEAESTLSENGYFGIDGTIQ